MADQVAYIAQYVRVISGFKLLCGKQYSRSWNNSPVLWVFVKETPSLGAMLQLNERVGSWWYWIRPRRRSETGNWLAARGLPAGEDHSWWLLFWLTCLLLSEKLPVSPVNWTFNLKAQSQVLLMDICGSPETYLTTDVLKTPWVNGDETARERGRDYSVCDCMVDRWHCKPPPLFSNGGSSLTYIYYLNPPFLFSSLCFGEDILSLVVA